MKVYILNIHKKFRDERSEIIFSVFKNEQAAIDKCRFLADAAAKSPDDILDCLHWESYPHIMVFIPEGYISYSYDEEEVIE